MSTVHIWRLDTRSYAQSRSLASALSPSEHRRSAQIVQPDVQRDFVAAHVALRRILAAWTGIAERELRFDTHCAHCGDSAHGRPALANRLNPAAPFFNLSRRDGLAVIAVTNAGAVGVDVESVGPGTKWDLIRGNVFTTAEASRLDQLGPQAASAAAVWWTRKEAVSKALGLGVALPFKRVTVGAERARGWVQVRLDQTTHRALPASATIAVRDLPIAAGYAAAVSVAGTGDGVSLVLRDGI